MDFYIDDDGAYVISEPRYQVSNIKCLMDRIDRINKELSNMGRIPEKGHDTKRNNARPVDLVKKVVFNERKGATTVLWNDGTVTVVKCSEEDEWDEEKAIAICFMKKMYQNRGCFNEFLRKYLDNAERL